MAHFAKLDEDNNVLEVHVVNNSELFDENGVEQEQKGIDFLVAWSGGYLRWKQTSYNATFRKNYCGPGYKYDPARDAFIPPKPFASWVLNENTCRWDAPVPRPVNGGIYFWNEATCQWIVPVIDLGLGADSSESGDSI
jgi:hypothetical protein